MSEDPTVTRERVPLMPLEKEPAERKGLWASFTDVRTFRALRYRNFRYLWGAQISNSAALWMEQVARPILVLSIVADPQQAAIHIGGVLAARTLPQLGFGMIAGVMADWYDRRQQLLIAQCLGAVVNLGFAAVLLSGTVELWHVYLTTILRGIFTSFDNPARQALLPSLVSQEHLANAVALNSASMQTMRIGAASLAGLSLAFIGLSGTFLAVGVISILPALFTYMMQVPKMPPVIGEKNIKAGFSSLWEGLTFAWQTPTIRGVLILTVAYFGLGMAYLQVYAPLFAKQIMHIGDAGFGFMVSLTGLGAVIGSLTVATFTPSRGRGKLMLGLMTALGIMLVLFGLSTYLQGMMGGGLVWVIPTLAIIGLVGVTQSSYFALNNTVLLENAPPEKRGRIMGVLALDRSMITLGGTIAGFLSAAIGPQLAQISFGVIVIFTAVSLSIFLPSLREIE